MGRIRNTIALAKASWQVLLSDKELIWLPVFSGIAAIIMGATFILPVVLTSSDGPLGWIAAAAFYFTTSFVVIFFNTALVSAAHERLAGGDPTIKSAIGAAVSHLPAIAAWAAISATVSAILKAIEERAGMVGSLVTSIAGLAWTLVTFMVIPVYVIEGGGVVPAIKRSASLFKATWGENMVANVGFGIIGFLAMLPFILIAILAIVSQVAGLAVAGIIVAVVGVVAVAIVMSTLSGIFQTALYMYASTGTVPTAFASTDLPGAFRPKRR